MNELAFLMAIWFAFITGVVIGHGNLGQDVIALIPGSMSVFFGVETYISIKKEKMDSVNKTMEK